MRLLDLFCSAGGGAVGYHRAGFTEIVGVDIQNQPRYPYDFIQANAMTWTDFDGFDLVHASPPCQGYSPTHNLPRQRDKVYPNLLPAIRQRLLDVGIPFIIENVPGAPMRADVILCGTMFGLHTIRHRWFEISIPVPILTPPCNHWGTVKNRDFWCVVGSGQRNAPQHNAVSCYANRATASWAMGGLDWMTRKEMVQAIPPIYSQYIGTHIIKYLDKYRI